MNFSVFEIGMMFCFGCAWPFNIYKSLRTRTAKGKSVMFLYILLVGYLFGIAHKLIYSRDIVLILYIINAAMVSVDVILYCLNAKRDKADI